MFHAEAIPAILPLLMTRYISDFPQPFYSAWLHALVFTCRFHSLSFPLPFCSQLSQTCTHISSRAFYSCKRIRGGSMQFQLPALPSPSLPSSHFRVETSSLANEFWPFSLRLGAGADKSRILPSDLTFSDVVMRCD